MTKFIDSQPPAIGQVRVLSLESSRRLYAEQRPPLPSTPFIHYRLEEAIFAPHGSIMSPFTEANAERLTSEVPDTAIRFVHADASRRVVHCCRIPHEDGAPLLRATR